MMSNLIIKTFFLALVLLVSSAGALSQTNAQIEKDLAAALKQIDKYSTYFGNYDEQKLAKANNNFEVKLLKYGKLPATLSYNFPKLGKQMHIATSLDGKFRIYSWDVGDGGTMHNFARLHQYKGADGKVYAKGEWHEEEDGGGGSFVYDIFSVNTKGGMVYIVCSRAIGSNTDHYQSADLVKIKGASFNYNVELIKTKSGLTSTLGFEYNPWSVSDLNGSYDLIKFDKKTNTLSIPVVIEDEEYPNGKVTDKRINYRFDGTNFVKVN